MKNFNLFSTISKENEDFDGGGHYIVGKPSSESSNYDHKGKKGGYYFSQRQVLEAIGLAAASKYKKGPRDEEGMRKTYINVVNFYKDVTKMKLNINVANYIFEPTDLDFTWPVWLMDRKFKTWAAINNFDELLDEFADSLASYGTLVTKKLEKIIERVPLRSLRNTQNAKSLWLAVLNGGFATIENEFHYNQMQEYPDWDLTGLSPQKSYTVWERYGLVPKKLLHRYKSMSVKDIVNYQMSSDEDLVPAQSIVIIEGGNSKDYGKKVLYMQEMNEITFPLEETHLDKKDGRWLGYGEIEKQLENQLGRNMTANLRVRGLLWSVKRVFQSSDPEVANNLLMEVPDGAVLEIKRDGNITPVNTQTQHSGDFQAMENMLDGNSKQNAFAFEVATGESMPSNTPLGTTVILDRAVATRFGLLREGYSNFLKRVFFDQQVPIFKSENKDEHTVVIGMSERNIEAMRETMLTWHTNERIFHDFVLKGKPVVKDAVRMEVEDEYGKNEYSFLKVPKNFYKYIQHYMKLNIADDIGADITTLTTLWQNMLQKGDPRADTVLQMILAKQGKTLPALIGPAPQQQPQQAGQMPQGVPSAPPQPSAATA